MTKQILVVDDEPNIVLSLKFLMDKQGYGVRAASNGDEALQAVEQAVPDLILLDVNMPGRSGFEVCEVVRANPAWKGTKILMLTAKGRDIDQEKGLALGADDYITKPFSTQEVVAKVKEFLGE
jgi:DNA-binding response OmpR family regulator